MTRDPKLVSPMAGTPPEGLPRKVLELEHAVFREEARDRLHIQEGLAQACLRSLVMVNGGAIIALFTLMGSNAEITKGVSEDYLWFAFASFAGGLAATIFANVAAFFMQIHYSAMTQGQMWNKELELANRPGAYDVHTCLGLGDKWEKIAVGAVVLAVVCFGAGAAFCFVAFV